MDFLGERGIVDNIDSRRMNGKSNDGDECDDYDVVKEISLCWSESKDDVFVAAATFVVIAVTVHYPFQNYSKARSKNRIKCILAVIIPSFI